MAMIKSMPSRYIDKEERDTDGYWIYLKPGWKNDDDPIGINHAIVENTKTEAYRHSPIPCSCKDCLRGERW